VTRPLRSVPLQPADEFTFTLADGTRLAVEADGPVDAAVSVVFVHGFTLNLTSFRNQRATLQAASGNVRRIFVDQRGFGGSERGPRGKASIDQLALDLAEIVEAAPGRVVLVGHSMGGMVILALAGLRPDLFGGRVRGTVLIATAASGAELDLHGLEGIARRLGGPLFRTLQRGRPLVRLTGRLPFAAAAWLFHDIRSSREHRRAFADMVVANQLDVLGDYVEAMFAYDARPHVGELSRTVTVVVAGKSDLVTPPEPNRRIVQAVHGARLVVVPRAGHMVPFENARAVDEAIADVVGQVLAQR
jgi:pimeloyl-ACP methyl ester carboxylesterase